MIGAEAGAGERLCRAAVEPKCFAPRDAFSLTWDEDHRCIDSCVAGVGLEMVRRTDQGLLAMILFEVGNVVACVGARCLAFVGIALHGVLTCTLHGRHVPYGAGVGDGPSAAQEHTVVAFHRDIIQNPTSTTAARLNHIPTVFAISRAAGSPCDERERSLQLRRQSWCVVVFVKLSVLVRRPLIAFASAVQLANYRKPDARLLNARVVHIPLSTRWNVHCPMRRAISIARLTCS